MPNAIAGAHHKRRGNAGPVSACLAAEASPAAFFHSLDIPAWRSLLLRSAWPKVGEQPLEVLPASPGTERPSHPDGELGRNQEPQRQIVKTPNKSSSLVEAVFLEVCFTVYASRHTVPPLAR